MCVCVCLYIEKPQKNISNRIYILPVFCVENDCFMLHDMMAWKQSKKKSTPIKLTKHRGKKTKRKIIEQKKLILK